MNKEGLAYPKNVEASAATRLETSDYHWVEHPPVNLNRNSLLNLTPYLCSISVINNSGLTKVGAQML